MRIRNALALFGMLSLLFMPELHAAAIPFFEINGGGSLFHFESVTAGQKPFVSSISTAQVTQCIIGNGNGCASGLNHLENDPGGKAFLFIVSVHQAFIATNTACTNSTQLQGNVGGDGSFMFSGHHTKSDTDVIVQGKITFDKSQFPSLSPLSIKKASILAVSDTLEHYAIGTFATVGAVQTFNGVCS